MLYPPQNKVKFNSKSDGNGFAFILKLSEKFQKRIPEADADVRNWVEELKSAVENNKSVSFDNFGTFFINAKGELGFDSAVIIELNIEYEGMAPIEVKPVEKEVYSEKASFVGEIKGNNTEITSENLRPEISHPSVSEPQIQESSVIQEIPEVAEITEPIKEIIATEPVKEKIVVENTTETETVISSEITIEEKETTHKKKNHKAIIFYIILPLIIFALGTFCYFYRGSY